MKRRISFSVTAFALTAVTVASVLFGMPVMSVSERDDASAGYQSAVSTDMLLLSSVTQSESSVIFSENTYESEESIPDKSTGMKPDEILPDADSSGDATVDIDEEKEGVKIIPVKINNSIRDSLASVVSENVYTFTVEKRGVIVYGFNHTQSESRDCMWYISLYEEYSSDGSGENMAYRELERVSYSTVGDACQSTPTGISPGNYRIVVKCISGFTGDKYDLAIGFAASDNYEVEPNNSKNRYTQMSLGVTLNGSASTYGTDENDVDWYMFRITQKGYAVLYFEHETDMQAGTSSNVAWRVQLTDMQGNEYYYVTSGMNSASLNSGIMGLSPGYYFVAVHSHVHSGVSYALNVSFTNDSAIETELNDSAEQATPISVNTETVGSLTARNDFSDRDYYSFVMENDGFVVLDFIHEALSESKEGWHITVMNESGEVAYSSVSDWAENIHHSPNIGLTAGKYYIRIDSDNIYHSSTVYRLILLTVQDGTWETEPNNIPSAADVIAIGTAVNGALVATDVDFDKDYYSVQTDKAGTLQVSFNHIRRNETDREGWLIYVIDSQGNVLSHTVSAWDSEEVTLTANVDAGTFYILVETGLFFNSDRYIINTVFG